MSCLQHHQDLSSAQGCQLYGFSPYTLYITTFDYMCLNERKSAKLSKKSIWIFFIFWDIKVYIFKWYMWKKFERTTLYYKLIGVLLSYLRVWSRFKVIYFILSVLVGGIWVKILTISNFLERKRAKMLLKVMKTYQNLFFMFYNNIWGTD